MSWTSRLTGQKRNIGQDEVKISVDRYLALERSVEELKSQNESLNATNNALNGRITELQKQLDEARMQLKERPADQKEGPEVLARVLRGFERLPEDLTPVPDEAAVENVKRLVENLNEQISQTAASITMHAIEKESPSKEATEKARTRIASKMGAGFLDFLEVGAQERETAAVHLRVGVQASLVGECGWIVNAFVYSNATKENLLWSMYRKFLRQKGSSLLTIGRWRSIVKQSIRDVRHELDETSRPTKAIEHVLARVDSIMVVMGYSWQNPKVRLEERVARCVKAALEVKTAMDKVISPILHVHWLRNSSSIGDMSEAEEVDKHMNPVHHPTPWTTLCSVALGLASREYNPAINGTSRKHRLRPKCISVSVLAAQTTRNTETRVITNEDPRQPVARTSNSEKVKVSRSSSNPVADDGPCPGSDPIDDDDDDDDDDGDEPRDRGDP